ncbi:8452_t:CDS:2, partial [Funneliformis geosporum]
YSSQSSYTNMLLDGFSLEILVNNVPLPEVTEKVDLQKNLITGPSYTCNEISETQDKSSVTHFAAVHEFGERYSIRFSAPIWRCSHTSPIKVFLYVDGEYDYSYTDINPNKLSDTRTCFWSKNRDKIYFFKFDPTIWKGEAGDSNPTKNYSFGGPGAVSVYFYRAKRMPWNVNPPPDYDVEPAAIPEGKDTRSIKIATQYDVQSVPNPSITRFDTYLQEQGAPLAVLHLHYRPAAYLGARGHNIIDPRSWISPLLNGRNHVSTHSYNDNQVLDVKIKEEPIVIKEEPEDRIPTTGRRRNRDPVEIIVLSSDSDDDDSHKVKKLCPQTSR